MTNKTMKITAPEGYEIDREKSTIDEIIFKPVKKTPAYADVAKELFSNSDFYYIGQTGTIMTIPTDKEHPYNIVFLLYPNNCTSRKQAEKLLALNMLMNTAKYLNKGWKARGGDLLVCFTLKAYSQELCLYMNQSFEINGNIYFKDQETAKQALEILGEDLIKTALSTDY